MEGVGAHLFNTALWDRLLKLSPNFFRRFTIGDLYWRLSSVDEMRRQVGRAGGSILLTALFSFFYLGIMAVYDKTLAGIAAGCTLFGLLVTIACGYWKSAVLDRSYEIQGQMRGLLIQILSGIGKLRTVGVEKNAFAHWATLFAKNKTFQMQAQNIQNLVTALSAILPIFSVWMIFNHIARCGGLSMPDFLAFNLAFGSFVIAIYPAFTTWMMLVNQAPMWRRARTILEEPLEQHHTGTAHRLDGEVLIDSVVFGYDPKMPPVLNGITIAIKRQELIGIVGCSGSGKSTLVRLLLGFEKPYSGAVYYDQKNLEYLNMRDIRKQIGVVFQGSGIMAGSLYDNLVCGGIYTKEQIEKSLELSGFAQDLEQMPMGLHTAVPTDGGTLSGGQKQRLLLARALISNPSLLIFDEATSAFDNRAQEIVSANIASLKVTRIVIAHRLSTIRDVDRIYVVDTGVVAQMGTYDELAKAPGIFAEMLERQKL
jgi:ABC-type bacteriocin/lantibiotic exporter with double-glycine peptidase domain